MTPAPSAALNFVPLEEGSVEGDLQVVSADEILARFYRAIVERRRASMPDRTRSMMGSSGSEVAVSAPTGEFEQDAQKVINLPRFEPIEGRPSETFAALQEWEGLVTGTSAEFVFADLIDITSKDNVTGEVAEIPLAEISEDDIERVVPGAIFRWAVGYVKKPSGQKMRGSLIYFRRGAVGRRSSSEETPPLRFAQDDA